MKLAGSILWRLAALSVFVALASCQCFNESKFFVFDPATLVTSVPSGMPYNLTEPLDVCYNLEVADALWLGDFLQQSIGGDLNISVGGIVHVCSNYLISDPVCPPSSPSVVGTPSTSPSPSASVEASPSTDSIPSPSSEPSPSSLKRQTPSTCELVIGGDVLIPANSAKGGSTALVAEAYSKITVEGNVDLLGGNLTMLQNSTLHVKGNLTLAAALLLDVSATIVVDGCLTLGGSLTVRVPACFNGSSANLISVTSNCSITGNLSVSTTVSASGPEVNYPGGASPPPGYSATSGPASATCSYTSIISVYFGVNTCPPPPPPPVQTFVPIPPPTFDIIIIDPIKTPVYAPPIVIDITSGIDVTIYPPPVAPSPRLPTPTPTKASVTAPTIANSPADAISDDIFPNDEVRNFVIIGVPVMVGVIIIIIVLVVVANKNKWIRSRVTPFKDREIYSVGSVSQAPMTSVQSSSRGTWEPIEQSSPSLPSIAQSSPPPPPSTYQAPPPAYASNPRLPPPPQPRPSYNTAHLPNPQGYGLQ